MTDPLSYLDRSHFPSSPSLSDKLTPIVVLLALGGDILTLLSPARQPESINKTLYNITLPPRGSVLLFLRLRRGLILITLCWILSCGRIKIRRLHALCFVPRALWSSVAERLSCIQAQVRSSSPPVQYKVGTSKFVATSASPGLCAYLQSQYGGALRN
jgi:hypothetical protein